MNKEIFLCAICNINSGTCLEDCKFCSQSVRYKADIDRYKQKAIEEILNEAKSARDAGALGFCLVTADKGLNDKTLEFVCGIAEVLTKEVPELRLIACNGTATLEQLLTLKKAGINFKADLLPDTPKVYLDAQLIEQVVLNLITNSADALRDVNVKKNILIKTLLDKKKIYIIVADSGEGLPEDLNEKIFDPFFSTKKNGTGIGLSICQRIITDHGGTIQAAPLKLGGTQFRISIPIEKRTNLR
ncbi:ATP-binding protein [Desulfobacterales bacterium HSG17]|nr:ATP-binding protein [Desulfobacterales bacterium HSG17]